MNIEFIKNPDIGGLEAWENGRVVGEFISTGMLAKGWRLTDCIVLKEHRTCSDLFEKELPKRVSFVPKAAINKKGWKGSRFESKIKI